MNPEGNKQVPVPHLREIDIIGAEEARTAGNFNCALAVMLPYVNEVLQSPDLSYRQTNTFNSALRIAVVSMTSLAMAVNNGETARSCLLQAKDLIERGYTDDNNLEQWRDVAAYWIALANFTGNSDYLNQALDEYIHIMGIARQQNNEVAGNVVDFDIKRYSLRLGEKDLDQEVIEYLGDTTDLFGKLRKSYWRSILFYENENLSMHERAATIAARFTAEAIAHGQLGDIIQGIWTFNMIATEDENVKSILKRQIARRFLDPVRTHYWQATLSPEHKRSSDLEPSLIDNVSMK